jgi:hypothetical protein
LDAMIVIQIPATPTLCVLNFYYLLVSGGEWVPYYNSRGEE